MPNSETDRFGIANRIKTEAVIVTLERSQLKLWVARFA